MNFEYRNAAFRSQCAYENSLLERLAEAPKLLHNYVRRRKVGQPNVGPQRLDSGQMSGDNLFMARCFEDAFSSVYNGVAPVNPSAHQTSWGLLSEVKFEVH